MFRIQSPVAIDMMIVMLVMGTLIYPVAS